MGMDAKNCEQCGGKPPRLTEGPFAGSSAGFDYCAYCSKDLCAACLENKPCLESGTGKHVSSEEYEESVTA